jgi:hypothetical protein
MTTPMGTLSQKIHCHAMPSVTAPPTSGPSAIATPAMPPQAPSARPRFSAGTASLRIVSVSGVTIAPPDALERAGGDQQFDRRGERRRGGSECEHAEADGEHPAAAEAVAERGAGEQQYREGEDVAVDRPLERLDAATELALDHGQGGRDDEVVQRGHERGERAERERPSIRDLGVVVVMPRACAHGGSSAT